MKGFCNGCGDCCAVVTLGRGQATKAVLRPYVRRLEAREAVGALSAEEEGRLGDYRWVMRLRRISRETAVRLRPGTQYARENRLYVCPEFNYESRECRSYAERPNVCRGFPWYDRDADLRALANLPRCGYRVDAIEHLRDWAPAHGSPLAKEVK